MHEHFFQCPYCWEQISMLIDDSQKHKNILKIVKFVVIQSKFQLSLKDRIL